MAKAVGVKVSKFTLDNVFIETYNSISEAARSLNVTQWTISRALKDPNYTSCGFKWKKVR
jgi:ActR/RegA family two-component response regulator